MKEEEKKAVGYIRVSTEEQSAKGVSIEAQEEKIRAYCALKDIQIVSMCIDRGVSGSKKLETREAGREMIYLLNEKKANILLLCKILAFCVCFIQFLPTLYMFTKNNCYSHSVVMLLYEVFPPCFLYLLLSIFAYFSLPLM